MSATKVEAKIGPKIHPIRRTQGLALARSAEMSYNEKWGRDDSKREDVQNRCARSRSNSGPPALIALVPQLHGRFCRHEEQGWYRSHAVQNARRLVGYVIGKGGRCGWLTLRRAGRIGTNLEQQSGVASVCAGCNRKIDNGGAHRTPLCSESSYRPQCNMSTTRARSSTRTDTETDTDTDTDIDTDTDAQNRCSAHQCLSIACTTSPNTGLLHRPHLTSTL